MISFLSSLLAIASISTNAIGAISTSSYSTNLKTNNNNSINSNSIDLSKINASVKNTWVSQSVWNQFQLQNANINLDYHTFNPQLTKLSWKQVILYNVAKGIDYHYNTLENTLYKQGNIFSGLFFKNQVWVTILGQKNASLALNNNNSDILKPFWEPNKEISTFYLRVSNNNSMNWNVNHSYLDVTLNICNFQYDNTYWTHGANPRFVASRNYTPAVINFDKTTDTEFASYYPTHTLFTRSAISTKRISTQFNTWSNANKFIDFYTFSAKIGTYLKGLFPNYISTYKNYYDQKETQSVAINYNSAFKQDANYYVGGYDKIVSKSTGSNVYANENNSVFSDIKVSEYDEHHFFDSGNVVFDMSFPTLQRQSVDNNLYLSLWFMYHGSPGCLFYIKVTAAAFIMCYNTNVFDNLYKI